MAGLFLCTAGSSVTAVEWVRPGISTNQTVWGIKGGMLWAIPPAGFRTNEPRGLIRVASPILPGSNYDLVNFIAIEPVVNGQKGFSELEPSALDGRQGKRIWAIHPNSTSTNLVPGTLSNLASGVERLEVELAVEPFQNGAHVLLTVSQRSDSPDEITLQIRAGKGSTQMDFCILTATMGNLARTRDLWLKGERVSSLRLYPEHTSTEFAPHTIYPLERLFRDTNGNVLVAVTTDEEDPTSVYPFPGRKSWHYGGRKVTQYWTKKADDIQADLHVAVNARYTYWQSRRPIPGGVSFENFELRERFYEGQSFTFGITARTPAELGFTTK